LGEGSGLKRHFCVKAGWKIELGKGTVLRERGCEVNSLGVGEWWSSPACKGTPEGLFSTK